MSRLDLQRRINEFNALQKNLCNDVIDEIRAIVDEYGTDGKIIYGEDYKSVAEFFTIVGDGVDAMEANLIVCGVTNFENGDVGVRLLYNDGYEILEDIGDTTIILSKDDLRSTIVYREDIVRVLYSLLDYISFVEKGI